MFINLREKFRPLISKTLFQTYRNMRMSLLYRGNNVECCVCGGCFSKMRDYRMPNRGFRPNEICPQCGSKPRHRLLAHYLKHIGLINQRILHVAPDIGLRQFIEPNNEYISANLFGQNIHINLNIQQLPFVDNSFDIIICSHVLEHVDNDKQAMRDLFRILKPGGWALLQTPLGNSNPDDTYEDKSIIDPEERLIHYGQEDHVRIYGENDFYARLRTIGFDLQLFAYADTLNEETISRYVLSNENLIIGHK